MENTIERGRWANYKVARIYINDGLVKEVELRLPTEILDICKKRMRALISALQQ